MRFAPLLLLGFMSTAHADEPARPYSRPLATTGIVVGGAGLATVVAGGIWAIAVAAGPRTAPPPCTVTASNWCLHFWDDGTRPAWDVGPGLAMIGIGAATTLFGAALVAAGLAPTRTTVAGNGVAFAF